MKIEQIVAHIIQVPVELTFEMMPVDWHLGVAVPSGWRFASYSKDEPLLKILAPSPFKGLERRVPIEFLPENLRIRIQYLVQTETERENATSNWNVRERRISKRLAACFRDELADFKVGVLICDRPKHLGDNQPYKRVDPWQMREDFLRTDSLSSLEVFLNKYGEFSRGTGPHVEWNAEGNVWWESGIVHPEQIWQRQQTVISALKAGAAKWFEKSRLELYSRPEFPHFVHTDHFIAETIETTITADFLRGGRFRLCNRKDCRLPFKCESRHKRSYCSQYCAHLESVRRNRRKKAVKVSGR